MRVNGTGRSPRLLIVLLVACLLVASVLWVADRWLLAGGDRGGGRPASPAGAGVVGLIVEPNDGRGPLLAEIEAARSTIDLMVYILTDEPVIEALIDARERGVSVRVMLDQYPYGGFGNPEAVAAELRAAGIEVKWGPSRFTFTHVKTMILDRTVALIMNLNLTNSAFESNRDFAIVTTRPIDVEAAQAIFEADWTGQGEPGPGNLIVSPINSRRELLNLVDSAETSLDIYLEVIRDAEIVAHLKSAAEQGVRVRVILSPDNDPVAEEIVVELVASGVDIRELSSPYIHAKAVVVDGERAFVGSQNFTATSLDENREIGVIFEDEVAIERLAATFEADFAGATEAVAIRSPDVFAGATA